MYVIILVIILACHTVVSIIILVIGRSSGRSKGGAVSPILNLTGGGVGLTHKGVGLTHKGVALYTIFGMGQVPLRCARIVSSTSGTPSPLL